MLTKYKHIILMDGGDGTFDYLYAKKDQQVWFTKDNMAFNYAGTKIYYSYHQEILKIFGLTPQNVIDRTIDEYVRVCYEGFKKSTESGKNFVHVLKTRGVKLDAILS